MIGRADRTDGEGKHSLQSVVFRGWLVVWGCLISLALNHSITLVHGALAPPPSLSLLSKLSPKPNRRGRAGCRSVEQRHYAASIASSEADQPELVGALRLKR